MKAKRLLFGIVAVVFLASVALPASGTGKITAFPYLDTDYSLITASGVTDENCSMIIKDEDGIVVYSIRRLGHSGVMQKVLDLSGLEDGEYRALISKKGNTLVSCGFFLVDGKILDDKASGVDAGDLSAMVFSQNNLLVISMLNQSRKAVEMTVEDVEGNELFSSLLTDEFKYFGKFDVSAFPQGTYYVSLASGQNKSQYVFKK
jgi:hypothetical protein